MRNFQDSFETRKRSFISAFSICMTVPLSKNPKILFEQITLKLNLLWIDLFAVFSVIKNQLRNNSNVSKCHLI